MKIGITVFPGSNCDHDCYKAIKLVTGKDPVFLWHKETSLQGCDALIIPGGFSYGDYLRCGAIARFSPIMNEVVAAAQKGMPVLGICNGFQILTECGLLPGVLMRNRSLNFICDTVSVKVTSQKTFFTKKAKTDFVYRIPIAHMDGNYYIESQGLAALEDNNQIVFRYSSLQGEINEESNPNGSLLNIAGVSNKAGNVVGLMPHPERVCDQALGGVDGRFFFEALL